MKFLDMLSPVPPAVQNGEASPGCCGHSPQQQEERIALLIQQRQLLKPRRVVENVSGAETPQYHANIHQNSRILVILSTRIVDNCRILGFLRWCHNVLVISPHFFYWFDPEIARSWQLDLHALLTAGKPWPMEQQKNFGWLGTKVPIDHDKSNKYGNRYYHISIIYNGNKYLSYIS